MYSDGWLALALVHLAATWAMIGILAVVHRVHYPSFGLVAVERYGEFQSQHMSRITGVLAVPWVAEIGSAAGLVLAAPTTGLRTLAAVGLVGVGLTLAITAFVAAPAHQRLLEGFDTELHRRLMAADLARAVVWLARGGVAGSIAWWSIT